MGMRKQLDRLADYGMLSTPDTSPPPDKPGIQGVPGGFSEVETGAGLVHRSKHAWPVHEKHGHIMPGELMHADPSDLTLLTPGEEPPSSWNDIVFLDTETTGLSTGTGTYVFLFGAAYFEEDELVIEQFFMCDPGREEPFLLAIRNLLESFSHVATFNGKSYDLPLLTHRYVISDLRPPREFRGHHDLLHPARNVFRDILSSCSLASLERNCLGVHRVDDVPGSEVPGLYFDFLQCGDSSYIEPVIEHNTLDLLSSVILVRELMKHIMRPESIHLTDQGLALARMASRAGEMALAERHYNRALECAGAGPAFLQAAREASLWYKRQHRWEEACSLWQDMVRHFETSRWSELGNPFPYVELAKYLEHRRRKYEEALGYTKSALSLVNRQLSLGLGSQEDLEALQHRRQRIVSKMGS